MAIVVKSFLHVLAWIPQFDEPSDSCLLANASILSGKVYCWENDIVDMLTEFFWCDFPQFLDGQVHTHTLADGIVLQE